MSCRIRRLYCECLLILEFALWAVLKSNQDQSVTNSRLGFRVQSPMDQVLDTTSHLFDLLFHSLDLIFPWLHLATKFLNFVVQDKLELLEFLILLLQIIDAFFLQSSINAFHAPFQQLRPTLSWMVSSLSSISFLSPSMSVLRELMMPSLFFTSILSFSMSPLCASMSSSRLPTYVEH